MANIDIRVGKKNAAFFAANPTFILKDGQLIFNSDTSELFIGNGVAQLSTLTPINGGSSYTLTASEIGSVINAAASATPNDTDLVISVDSSIAKKNTWTQIKTFLKTYFDSIYTTTSAVATQITTALSGYLTSSAAASTYEPIFSKNTAFNKNFGTTAGTVLQGNALDGFNTVNLIRQEFTYTSGAQTFTLSDSASAVYAVFVNGQELRQSQYTVVTTTLTIVDTLEASDRVDVIYSNATLGINPSYTKSETDTLLNAKVTSNASITGATKTKITYDAKGLVTSGADATTSDIADSVDKRYVTDAQLVVIANTSGTNTGDQDLSGYVQDSDFSSHSVLAKQSGAGSPVAVTIGTNEILGRLSGGGANIEGLSTSQVKTLLDLAGTNTGDVSVTDGSTIDFTLTGQSLTAEVKDSSITEAKQILADNTTNDVSTTKHGYAPKLPNDATKYLDGTGAYTVPAGGGGGGTSATSNLFSYYNFI